MGFDWEERSQVWTKVKEEIGEFEAEVVFACRFSKSTKNLPSALSQRKGLEKTLY